MLVLAMEFSRGSRDHWQTRSPDASDGRRWPVQEAGPKAGVDSLSKERMLLVNGTEVARADPAHSSPRTNPAKKAHAERGSNS